MFTAIAGGLCGVIVGVMIVTIVAAATGHYISSPGISGMGLTAAALGLTSTAFSRSSIARLDEMRRARAAYLTTTPGAAAPTAGRVRRVYNGQRRLGAVSALVHGTSEPTRLALVEALTTPPQQVYTQLPERYGIMAGAPVALLVDRSEPEIVLLDDRVTAAQLESIRVDPRWQNARFGSIFARQGGFLLLVWGGSTAVVTATIGLLLVLL